MRKFLMILFFITFIFLLISCGKDEKESSPSVPEVLETPPQEEETPVCEHKELKVGQEVITECGTIAKFYECSCGYREYITLVGGCYVGDSTKEETDEQGNSHMSAVCAICECEIYIKYQMKKDENCLTSHVLEYVFTQNGTSKTYTLVQKRGSDHESGDRQEVDLAQYGICQGTLSTHSCKDCGKFCDFYFEDLDNICSTAVIEDIDYVDKDGSYHLGTLIKCDVCKFEGKYEQVYNFIFGNECEYIMYLYEEVKVGSNVLYLNEYSTYGLEHDCEYEYTKLGANCLEGVLAVSSCPDCNITFKEIINEHVEGDYAEITFDDYDTCYFELEVSRCSLCDEICQIWSATISCGFELESETEETVDGIEHIIKTERCSKCGLIRTSDWVCKGSEDCYTYYDVDYKYTLYGDVLLEYNEEVEEENHLLETTYHLQGETCEDGVVAETSCTNCEHCVTTPMYYEHQMETTITMMNSLESNVCQNNVYYSECIACNYVECSTYSDCYFVETESYDNFRLQQCLSCGLEKIYDYEVLEDLGSCNKKVLVVQKYNYLGTEIFAAEYTTKQVIHDMYYTTTLLGETCEDGIEYVERCHGCDHYYTDTYYTHSKWVVFDCRHLEGSCSTDYIQIMQCPCKKTDYQLYTNLSYNGEGYSCEECSLRIELSENKQGTGCNLEKTTTLVVKLEDETLFTTTCTANVVEHQFVYETSHNNDKLYLDIHCSGCDLGNTYEIYVLKLLYHNYDKYYYYDFNYMPLKTGDYSVIGLDADDTYCTIYRDGWVAAQDDESNGSGQFKINYYFEYSVLYTMRLENYYGDPDDTFYFAIAKGEIADCSHTNETHVFTDGETGDTYEVTFCSKCGVPTYFAKVE